MDLFLFLISLFLFSGLVALLYWGYWNARRLDQQIPQGRPIAPNHQYLQARRNHSGSARFDHYGGSNCTATWPVRSTDLRSAKSVTKVIRAAP